MLLDTAVMLLLFASLILVLCKANRSAMVVSVIALVSIIVRILIWAPQETQHTSSSSSSSSGRLAAKRTPRAAKPRSGGVVLARSQDRKVRGLGLPVPQKHRDPPKLITPEQVFQEFTADFKRGHHQRVNWDDPKFAKWRAAEPQSIKAQRARWEFDNSAQRTEPKGYRERVRKGLLQDADWKMDEKNPYLRELPDE
jgi:hypothetical protein